jgi:hypothetical protein
MYRRLRNPFNVRIPEESTEFIHPKDMGTFVSETGRTTRMNKFRVLPLNPK